MAETVTLALLLPAAVFDAHTGKIPNVLIVLGLGAGCAFCFYRARASGLLFGLASAAVITVLGFFLFRLRAFGAGDVKLWAVIACINGLGFCLETLAVTLVLAGVVSLVKMVRFCLVRERFLTLFNAVFFGGCAGTVYYDKKRDGKKCTVVMAPFTAIAYVLAITERWMVT